MQKKINIFGSIHSTCITSQPESASLWTHVGETRRHGTGTTASLVNKTYARIHFVIHSDTNFNKRVVDQLHAWQTRLHSACSPQKGHERHAEILDNGLNFKRRHSCCMLTFDSSDCLSVFRFVIDDGSVLCLQNKPHAADSFYIFRCFLIVFRIPCTCVADTAGCSCLMV